MKPEDICYTTDIVLPYVQAIRQCKTADELRKELSDYWTALCPDAVEQAKDITDEQWAYVKKNSKVRRNAKKVSEIAGAILLPETLIRIAALQQAFSVPDGCCYIRLKELEGKKNG